MKGQQHDPVRQVVDIILDNRPAFLDSATRILDGIEQRLSGSHSDDDRIIQISLGDLRAAVGDKWARRLDRKNGGKK